MIANSKNLIRAFVIFVSMWQTICLGQITASLPYCSPSTLKSNTTNQVVLAFTATNNTNGTIENVGGDIVLSKNTYIDGADQILWSDTFLHDTLGPFESFRYGWPAYGGTWPLKIPPVTAGPYYIIFKVYPGGDTSYTPVEIISIPTEVVLQASEPSPAHGALHFETWANLSWKSGDTAVSHDVYVGDSYSSVYNATPGTGTFKGNQIGPTVILGFPGGPYPNGLVPGTTYYWRIDEVEADGTVHKGDVWNFSTEYMAILDEEQTLDYDNSVYPYVTELVLDTPADLTDGGVFSYLIVSFQGNPKNSAEPIYVKLEDSTGAVYTVTYPDPAATQIADRIDWTIKLSEFVDVDPKKAEVLSLVTGTEGEPGGTGEATFFSVKAVPEAGIEERITMTVGVRVRDAEDKNKWIVGATVNVTRTNPYESITNTTEPVLDWANCKLDVVENVTYTLTVEAEGYIPNVKSITITVQPDNSSQLVELEPDVNVYPVKRMADDGDNGDWLGRRVSISGKYAIAGANRDDDDRGSAYIFENSATGWKQQMKLTALSPAAGERFGCDVSISGDNAIVGADRNNYYGPESGAAYIFQRTNTGWEPPKMLVPLDGGIGHRFGCAVSISGNYSIIGSRSGSAYIFRQDVTGWIPEDKLTAWDGAEGNWFGYAVSISGNYAIVGAVLDNSNGTDSGSAYVFKRNGSNWVPQTKLVVADGQAGDEFGGSVCLSGSYAIIGAIGNDDKGEDSGAAYIFERSGENWIEQQKLVPLDGAGGDHFGNSVSIDGDYAVVAAILDADKGTESGSAYIFKREGQSWDQQAKLTAPDGNPRDYFGQGVSIDGSYVIVGAPNDDDNGGNSGSVYMFKRIGTTWMP